MQVDEALKTADSVTAVLDATLHVLHAESLDAPPRPLGELPSRLEHFAANGKLPPTPEGLLLSGRSSSQDLPTGEAADGSALAAA